MLTIYNNQQADTIPARRSWPAGEPEEKPPQTCTEQTKASGLTTNIAAAKQVITAKQENQFY